MTKTSATEKNNSDEQSWERVLSDARVQLEQTSRRAKELRGVIRVLEAKVAANEPFPVGAKKHAQTRDK
jgi:hypothetical protein